ncbi:MAG: hypothetical protein JRD89_17955 [Deltaproteobacteria bacterium]|nr:hypothetical protein [Deltaproteobacteria bacterium]
MFGLEEWSWEAIPHCAAGLVTPWFALVHPVLAVLAFLAFVIYELEEFVEIRDKAHRDLQQYAVGLYISATIMLVVCGAI